MAGPSLRGHGKAWVTVGLAMACICSQNLMFTSFVGGLPNSRSTRVLNTVHVRRASTNEPATTWKEAHDMAKTIELKLSTLIGEGRRRTKELDELFLGSAIPLGGPIPGRPPLPDSPTDVGQETLFPDVEKYPPLLENFTSAGESFVGKYSSQLELPQRITTSSFLETAGDDPNAGDEANQLWKEAAFLRFEELDDDSLWQQGEEALQDLRAAEQRAEARKGATLGDFRERVLTQMSFAYDKSWPREELSSWLTALETDPRLLKWLGLLEMSALEAEGLQEAIDIARAVSPDMQGSERRKLQQEFEQSYARTKRLDLRIRSCAEAGRDLPGQLDSMQEVGDFFNSINPFR